MKELSVILRYINIHAEEKSKISFLVTKGTNLPNTILYILIKNSFPKNCTFENYHIFIKRCYIKNKHEIIKLV